MADLAIPSSVSILEAKIERKKACGQRFPVKPNSSIANNPSSSGDVFRSARCAPNEQVRQSVKAHPSNSKRHDPPLELSLPRDTSPSRKSPSKRSPVGSLTNLDSTDIDDELFQNAPAISASMASIGVNRVNGDYNQYRINVPQRIEPPKDLNTPARIEGGKVANGGAEESAEQSEPTASTPDAVAGLAKNLSSLAMNKKQASVTRMRDQEMLAFACHRANKGRNEGLAYYNMGVLHDNEGEHGQAIRCYERFLDAARAAGDSRGEQLALNSMAVDYHLMGAMDRAAEASAQHLQAAANDIAGKMVAHCNLGLALAAMGELEKAALNHRHSLRYAIVLSSPTGESVACGNLGTVSARRGDTRTARACMERHLKLAAALGDRAAQLDAAQHLGQLANDAGEHAEAAAYFEQARALAQEAGQGRLAAACKCRVGMSRGDAALARFLADFSHALVHADADADADPDGEAGGGRA